MEATALPTRVAVGALLEVGRPDLAVLVRPNRTGKPTLAGTDKSFGNGSLPTTDELLLHRAFLIGHRSVHPIAIPTRDSFGNIGITCRTCEWIRRINQLAEEE